MSIRHSLLTILAQGSCYGYQLRSEYDRRTGSAWPLNAGQLYSTLDRLVRDNFAVKNTIEMNEAGKNSPTTYYTITESGQREANRWLSSPIARPTAGRDELAIKLALAITLPGVDAIGLIARQRESTSAIIEAHALSGGELATAGGAATFAEQLISASVVSHAQAELRWLDDITSALIERGTNNGIKPFPLSTEKPKRGRPTVAATERQVPRR